SITPSELYDPLLFLRLIPAEDHLQDRDAFVEALLGGLARLYAVDEVLDLADESVLRFELMLLRILAVRLEEQIIAPAEDLARFADRVNLPVPVRPGMSP